MPIVFVHGVNNRDDEEFRAGVTGRDAFIREFLAPALNLPGEHVSIENPYWGGSGARFAWDMSVLPSQKASYVAFGPDTDATSFADEARDNPNAAIERAFAFALSTVTDKNVARELAGLYRRAGDYLARYPNPPWLADATQDNFVDLLTYHIGTPNVETLGGSLMDVRRMLVEGMQRTAGLGATAGFKAFNSLFRKSLNERGTRFVGDALIYFANRGKPGAEGPIVSVVSNALKRASAMRTPQDCKLVVIGHSFGGAITYDIATSFATDLSIDLFVSVGSQVALFEEMKLYLSSEVSVPNPLRPRVSKPTQFARWLNVFDRADPFSYVAAPVFENVEDYEFVSNTTSPHSGYFRVPRFYSRLAERLTAR